ncbi:Co-chaperonin GroES (HSP10) [Tistlia consotensis]|uniref:Co-chaperonin GroES n=1 Tax=Tistlia consotensis USBA 355 TaxID=560819 RepID=A0A1Y6BRQ1_9PROT|nr:Co-chaperonin GroES (HSP10) [Tistlia consotensis USBA 355]SNR59344.1 Co-chaperonin GroES (HSP10) [Tistlia consotensis]
MKFRPLHDRLVVEPVATDERTVGGIIIPDSAREKPQQGKVVAAGPGSRGADGRLTPIDVKPGDIVLYGKWSGTEVKVDGKDLLVMRESDIMGIVEPAGAKPAAAPTAKKAAPARKPAAKAAAAPKKAPVAKAAAKPAAAAKKAAAVAKKAAPAVKKAAPAKKPAAKAAAKPAAKAVAKKAAPKKAAAPKAASRKK